jgi:hypothetical protein
MKTREELQREEEERRKKRLQDAEDSTLLNLNSTLLNPINPLTWGGDSHIESSSDCGSSYDSGGGDSGGSCGGGGD